MSKEKFNWKSLFVNDENQAKLAPEAKTRDSINFPTEKSSHTKFPEQHEVSNTQSTGSHINNSILEEVLSMYESGFDSLNVEGYDFYEFFKAIKAVNSNDPSVYKMAITMAQSVDKKVDRNFLLNGADFYIKEIEKVHKEYSDKGNSKREQIQSNLSDEKTRLTQEVSDLEKQILELQTKISQKKNSLQSSDSNLLSNVSDIEQKIVANDMAKAKILGAITKVVDGIKNNL